ncbi:hypothetical protein C8Q70DRAFT_1059104 [Cubamyces menziesii]|nr:hypothetical protein C8Q70DRAFT_1059104 [Cubamyces menziesii]
MNALFALAFAASHLSSTVLLGVFANPAPAPNPMITPAPVVGGSVQRARAADDVPTTIPLADCLFSVECCQQVFTLPVLPLSLTTALPITAPIPLPTLGPLAGVDCSDASDLDPITNQCLSGGTPLCCQDSLLGLAAEGCQQVVLVPTISLPSLPIPLPTSLPISLPIPSLPLPISLPLGLADSDSSDSLTLPISIPTSLPIPIPTSLPTSLPIPIPSSSPTSISTSTPDPIPTSIPTSLPIPIPTSLPTSLPISIPISLPIPTSLPTSLPISLPTSLPISLPIGL